VIERGSNLGLRVGGQVGGRERKRTREIETGLLKVAVRDMFHGPLFLLVIF
jgi:hypothetical protein